MPTAKPRVNVTMDQSLYDLLSRYARALGVSRSAAVEMLLHSGWNGMIDVVKRHSELEVSKGRVGVNPEMAEVVHSLKQHNS